jgi:hypothetical protein
MSPTNSVSLRNGRLAAAVAHGELRGLAFDGVEVLRGVNGLLRDANWGTVPLATVDEAVTPSTYRRRFVAGDQAEGVFEVVLADEDRLVVSFEMTALRRIAVNRAGLTVLHPIRGVAGGALGLRHADGRTEETHFPARIAPAQPAFDIVGMSHSVGPLRVAIEFEGEIFEMEDQRNWSDASFKTYCRPLALPKPFWLEAGEVVRQTIRVQLARDTESKAARGVAPGSVARSVRIPQVLLASEGGLAPLPEQPLPLPVLARIDAATPDADLAALSRQPAVAAEIVFDDIEDLARQATRLASSGVAPIRVTALPRAYLHSHQPTGPWPEGPTPADAVPVLRRLLPGVPVGGGSLTHFTEANRCPPSADADFITFGNSAIVHAADDLSVLQTLEALPDIFASAAALLPGKPLHLGLFSIGMRSNPYGAGVTPNPHGARLTMATVDPRQDEPFAAAYAGAVLAEAALAGCASLALAMTGGPLGADPRPLGAFLRHVAALAGDEAEIVATAGHWRVAGRDGGYEVTLEGDQPRLSLWTEEPRRREARA